MPFVEVIQELKANGFRVQVTDGGIIAHLQRRTPSRDELVRAVSELEGMRMKTVGGGVYIRIGKEGFS